MLQNERVMKIYLLQEDELISNILSLLGYNLTATSHDTYCSSEHTETEYAFMNIVSDGLLGEI